MHFSFFDLCTSFDGKLWCINKKKQEKEGSLSPLTFLLEKRNSSEKN